MSNSNQHQQPDAALPPPGCHPLFEKAPIALAQASLEGDYLAANRRLLELLGYSEDELKQLRYQDTTCPEDASGLVAATRDLLRGNVDRSVLECRFIHKDRSMIWGRRTAALVRDQDGTPDYFIIAIEDISEEKTQAANLARQAYHDPLTGLHNRGWLLEHLERVMRLSQGNSPPIILLKVNINRFKRINETLGFAAGDAFLRIIANRLQEHTAGSDAITRLDSDKFVAVFNHVLSKQDLKLRIQKLQKAFQEPVALDNDEIILSANYGVAIYPTGGAQTPEGFLAQAAEAMLQAKRLGPNELVTYQRQNTRTAYNRLHIESGLHQAISRNELSLVYQPQVDATSGQVIGAEALLRWNNPQLGHLPPAAFIPVAEETGMILPIGEWVMRTACEQLHTWQQIGLPLPRLSVNLSARQFRQSDLVERIQQTLAETRVAAEQFEVEITETVLIDDLEAGNKTLASLKRLGVHVALDDFGIGYSSLHYLKHLPNDRLKIDSSFIAGLVAGSQDMTIARAIIELAHGLQLSVIAEGVETEEQVSLLREMGCEGMQGFFFSEPLTPEAFADYLRNAPQ
jgi:diguanylate cyclase (GGDEF)-like protein/PAS domain S-box-containing protein